MTRKLFHITNSSVIFGCLVGFVCITNATVILGCLVYLVCITNATVIFGCLVCLVCYQPISPSYLVVLSISNRDEHISAGIFETMLASYVVPVSYTHLTLPTILLV